MQFKLPARPPFRFLSVVHSHGWVQLAPFAFDEETATLTDTDWLSSGRVLAYQITETDNGITVKRGNCQKQNRRKRAPEQIETSNSNGI